MFNHISVMLRETIDALNIKQDGIYIDCTLGGGGHSSVICSFLETGKLIGIDRDESAINAAQEKITCENFIPVHDNFHNLPDILDKLDISRGTVSGILMDLGVSSYQLDTPERGFSYRFEGQLDMRMDKNQKLTAKEIVNLYSEKELTKIFFEYGEERYSRRIARSICAEREISPIETTLQLAKIIEKSQPKAKKNQPHPAMRTFMALRIAVNDELNPLMSVIKNSVDYLQKGGRFVCITFHSLEDRIVKTTFAKLANPCECPRDIPYCVCETKPSLRVITRKPILPSAQEISENSRSHSAKLRVAEKT